jgi:hypothetical protein
MRHSVASARTAESAGSQLYTPRDQHEWEVTSSLRVYCVMCEKKLSFLMLSPFHSNYSEISVSCWFVTDSVYSQVI